MKDIAARVGEHGKGFAVVATEVGKLATDSVATAERAGGLLGEIVPNIAKTSGLLQELAATAEEMTTQTANPVELMRFFKTGNAQRATGGPCSWTPEKQTQRPATLPAPRAVQAQPWRAGVGAGVFEQF
jgi:methyl-accepting chemotaxis protein